MKNEEIQYIHLYKNHIFTLHRRLYNYYDVDVLGPFYYSFNYISKRNMETILKTLNYPIVYGTPLFTDVLRKVTF